MHRKKMDNAIHFLKIYRIMIFGAVLYWHWEAMLISYLATRVITLPFNGIETLLSQSDFNIALNPGTSYEDSFKISTDPVWQAAWIGRIQPYLEEYIPMFGKEKGKYFSSRNCSIVGLKLN